MPDRHHHQKRTHAHRMASESPTQTAAPSHGLDVIRAVIADDLKNGRYSTIVTRFPPEPNGYLHIGHATSVALNFGVAAETGGVCHLRFDDTNPETEDALYVEAIKDVIHWLGYEWGEHLYFASDYFEKMYEFAEHLIREGKAYVDSLNEEEIREYRGTVTEAGRPSPYRSRSVDENLDIFRRMRAGEFPDGAHVLRAKIDMASRNMLLRDPILYRIRHAHHYRTGDTWCIYPLYDYAHPIEDALECVTHSVCTLEFENNRPLYDWVVENIPVQCRPHQYEFARRNLDYTVMSKRKLLELVRGGHVSGWDDPRMPTIAAFRRRGVTPASIRSFCEMVGVARTEIRVDIGKLEFAIRDDLNQTSPRVLCVLRPLKVVITNYPEGEVEEIEAPLYPRDVPKEGSRILPFSREIYIERDDFMETPPPGYHRLAPGQEVRLRYAYIIRCHEVIKDESGEVVELRCSYDAETRGGRSRSGKSVKGTVHWVSAAQSLPCEVRLYDRLFSVPDPEASGDDFRAYLNPESLVVVAGARIEPSVRNDEPGSRYQFERLGFFCSDMVDSSPERLVYNRTVTLRDTWAKLAQADAPAQPAAATAKSRPAAAKQKPKQAPAGPVEERTPELEARRERYVAELDISPDEADVLSRDRATSELFESALKNRAAPARAIANWIVQELPRAVGDRSIDALPITGESLAELVALVEGGTISGTTGRQVLAEMAESGQAAAAIVENRGLQQINDRGALEPLVSRILAANPAKVEEYRGGKAGLRGFFVGQVMRETSGRANPELVGVLIDEQLGN
jgi:glutaminyl-tRNA synthetase